MALSISTHFSHMAPGSKAQAGKQPATCYLTTAAGLFCFNKIAGSYFAGFGTMQPSRMSWVTALAGCLVDRSPKTETSPEGSMNRIMRLFGYVRPDKIAAHREPGGTFRPAPDHKCSTHTWPAKQFLNRGSRTMKSVPSI
jgi:hypothetical protein